MNQNGCRINHRKQSAMNNCHKCKTPRKVVPTHKVGDKYAANMFTEVPKFLPAEEYLMMADELEIDLERINEDLDDIWEQPGREEERDALQALYQRKCVTEDSYRALAHVRSNPPVNDETLAEALGIRQSMDFNMSRIRASNPDAELDPVENQAYQALNNYLRDHKDQILEKLQRDHEKEMQRLKRTHEEERRKL